MVRKIHLYVALIFGAVFSLLGVSGSWLVFYPQLDSRLLGFQTQREQVGDISWQRIIEAADRTIGASRHMTMIMRPIGAAAPALVMSQQGPQMLSIDYAQAYIDPASGEVLAARQVLSADQTWSQNLTGIAFAMHSGLFMGPVGYVLIAILGLFLLCSVLTGLWVWWPRGRWRVAAFLITTRPGSRAFLGDLHRVSGLYASLLLGVMIVTGVYYGLRPLVTQVVSAVLPVTPAHGMSSYTGSPAKLVDAPAVDLDGIVAAARAVYPRRDVQGIVRMGNEHPSYQVMLAPYDNSSRSIGATEVYVAANGAVTGIRDPAAETSGDTLLRWLIPIHTGVAFGTAGRAVVCAIGLLPLAFFITGVIVWMRRSKAATTRRRARHD